MLNIMTKPKAEKVTLTVRMVPGQLRIMHVPMAMVGKRYAMTIKNGRVEIYQSENGCKCDTQGGTKLYPIEHGLIRFGKKRLPFQTFDAVKVKIEAEFDGNTLRFEMPAFKPRTDRVFSQQPAKQKKTTEQKDVYADFRDAINAVNKFTKQFNGVITVTDNQIRVTLQTEV